MPLAVVAVAMLLAYVLVSREQAQAAPPPAQPTQGPELVPVPAPSTAPHPTGDAISLETVKNLIGQATPVLEKLPDPVKKITSNVLNTPNPLAMETQSTAGSPAPTASPSPAPVDQVQFTPGETSLASTAVRLNNVIQNQGSQYFTTVMGPQKITAPNPGETLVRGWRQIGGISVPTTQATGTVPTLQEWTAARTVKLR